MSTIGAILGVLIMVNFILNIADWNIPAIGGWFVAGLEWMRRLLV